MSYLLAQILLCLLIAGIIGAIIGWLLRGDCGVKLRDCDAKWQKKFDELEANWHGKYQEIDSERKNLRSNLMSTQANVNSVEAKLAESAEDMEDCYEIEEVEGIGPAYGKRLRTIGISSTCDLVRTCLGNEDKIQEIAKTIKVKKEAVADWTGMADLMRLPGVNGQFAELIQTVGTVSVDELAKVDAKVLLTKMSEFNAKTSIVPEVPALEVLTEWISAAKKTDNLV